MPTFVALLKISGKTDIARKRLMDLPHEWEGVVTKSVIFGSGGYDAVVTFEAPDVTLGLRYISNNLRDNDPLTLIDTVTGSDITPIWT